MLVSHNCKTRYKSPDGTLWRTDLKFASPSLVRSFVRLLAQYVLLRVLLLAGWLSLPPGTTSLRWTIRRGYTTPPGHSRSRLCLDSYSSLPHLVCHSGAHDYRSLRYTRGIDSLRLLQNTQIFRHTIVWYQSIFFL